MNLFIGVIIAIVAYIWFTSPDGKPKSGPTSAAADSLQQTSTAASTAKKRKGKKNKRPAAAGSKADDEKDLAKVADASGEQPSAIPTNPEPAVPTTTSSTTATTGKSVPDATLSTRSSPAKPSSRSSTPSSNPRPDMDTEDDSEGSPSRVLRVKGPDDFSATDLGAAEDGWQMVEVSKKPANKPRSITLVGSSSSTSSARVPPPSQADPATLTKKQRENLRKAERVKAAKTAQVDEQQLRLKEHRREQERSWVAKQAAGEKQAARDRAMAKNNRAAAQDPSGSVDFGKGIWD